MRVTIDEREVEADDSQPNEVRTSGKDRDADGGVLLNTATVNGEGVVVDVCEIDCYGNAVCIGISAVAWTDPY